MCRNSIWAISILAIFLLSGCAPSTHDLIEKAQLTGDWTLVNKRIAAIERREAQAHQTCPRGTKRWCIRSIRDEKCSCVSDSEFRDMAESLGL